VPDHQFQCLPHCGEVFFGEIDGHIPPLTSSDAVFEVRNAVSALSNVVVRHNQMSVFVHHGISLSRLVQRKKPRRADAGLTSLLLRRLFGGASFQLCGLGQRRS
jgi:hypothetical protein